MQGNAIPIALTLGLFALAFAAIWFGALYAVGRIGAWHKFAETFPDKHPPESYSQVMAYGLIGGSKYGGVLKLHAGSRGLHMAVIFPFTPGHPPLCLPWHQLRFAEEPQRIFPVVRIEVMHNGRELDYIKLRPQTAEALGLRDRIRD